MAGTPATPGGNAFMPPVAGGCIRGAMLPGGTGGMPGGGAAPCITLGGAADGCMRPKGCGAMTPMPCGAALPTGMGAGGLAAGSPACGGIGPRAGAG
jgi:hypothetical protein